MDKTHARLHGVPASEFVGLVPGMTYYAFDPDTMTYSARAFDAQVQPPSRLSVQGRRQLHALQGDRGMYETAFFNDGLGVAKVADARGLVERHHATSSSAESDHARRRYSARIR